MAKNKLSAGMAAMVALGSSAGAQGVYYTPPPQSYAGAVQQRYFPVGTPLALTTRSEVSTKDVKPGDRVYLSLAESLTFRGQIIVPVGTPAVGEIAWSDKNGYFGKKGKLGIRLLYIETPTGQKRIEGETSKTGKSGTAASIATIVLVSPLGFLVHGTSARIPYGAPVRAYLAEPLTFVELPARPQTASLAAGEPIPVSGPEGPGFRW